MQIDTQDKAGTAIGGLMGMLQAAISGNELLATIILSFLGALVGFLSTELFKFIKRKIIKP